MFGRYRFHTVRGVPALATWTPDDGLLGAAAPLALGLAAPGPCLVVDLDPEGPAFPGSGSLAALVADGPRRADLVPPRRSGTAVLRNGGVSVDDAGEVLGALLAGWPFLVARLPVGTGLAHSQEAAVASIPRVPVLSTLPVDLWPGRLPPGAPAVQQRLRSGDRPSRPGPVLPRPGHGTWQSLLAGRIPAGDPWIRAWRPVWSHRWM